MMLAVIILGGIGWALGRHAGLIAAWLLSSLGSILGVYIGWRIGRTWLE